jgi:hypothetical protein
MGNSLQGIRDQMKNFILGICLSSLFWVIVWGCSVVWVERQIKEQFAWATDVKAEWVKAWSKQNRRR